MSAPTDQHDERAAFEAWIGPKLGKGSHLRRSEVGGVYLENRVADKWSAWAACAARHSQAPQPAQAEPVAKAPKLVQRGWLIEWPTPGGGPRTTLWSAKDSAAKAIGCPHEPVYALRSQAEPVKRLSDGWPNVGSFFAEEWAQQAARNMLHDFERDCATAWGLKLEGE